MISSATLSSCFFFFFNDTATTEIYTLSLHDGSSDLPAGRACRRLDRPDVRLAQRLPGRSEEHTSELQSRLHLVCRLLLEKKKKKTTLTCPRACASVVARS